jgi:hypothetical protein
LRPGEVSSYDIDRIKREAKRYWVQNVL